MNTVRPLSADEKTNIRRAKARVYCAENRERRRELNRKWIQENRQRYYAAKSRYRLKLKMRVMAMYADPVACVRCGFSCIDGLVLDHINDDGSEQRKRLKIGHRSADANIPGTRIYEYIHKHGKLDGLQVLCANCNTIKQIRKTRRDAIKDPAMLEKLEKLYGY